MEAGVKFLSDLGPIAFGVIALLVVWKYIVQPQLDRAKLDFTSVQLLANTLKETATLINIGATQLKQLADELREIQGDIGRCRDSK